jgi:hypothetical protein
LLLLRGYHSASATGLRLQRACGSSQKDKSTDGAHTGAGRSIHQRSASSSEGLLEPRGRRGCVQRLVDVERTRLRQWACPILQGLQNREVGRKSTCAAAQKTWNRTQPFVALTLGRIGRCNIAPVSAWCPRAPMRKAALWRYTNFLEWQHQCGKCTDPIATAPSLTFVRSRNLPARRLRSRAGQPFQESGGRTSTSVPCPTSSDSV